MHQCAQFLIYNNLIHTIAIVSNLIITCIHTTLGYAALFLVIMLINKSVQLLIINMHLTV